MAPPSNAHAVVLEQMTMGQESAAHLVYLLPASPHQELAAEILRCCGRVIAAIRAGGGGEKRKAVEHEDAAATTAVATCFPPRKRSRGAEAPIRVVTSGTTVDGFIWRKYGQKKINGRKHPRLYHRCAYSHQGCTATRRVQRTHEEEQPPAYEIAYYGHHTCCGAGASSAPAPPPYVVDSGSNAWVSVGGLAPPSEHHQLLSWDGEMSSASSAETGFEAEAQTVHEWHDTARTEEPSATALPYAPDPVTQFLDGSFDWASVLNDDPFDFGSALQHVATLQ